MIEQDMETTEEHSSNGLPLGWTSCAMGDIVSDAISNAGPPDDGEFVYVDISSVNNQSKCIEGPKYLPFHQAPSRARQRLRANDVIVSMTRPNLNAVALVPINLDGAIGSTGFCVLRPLIEPKYVFYRVQSPEFIEEMVGLIQGVLYPAVRPRDILSHRLPLPPLAEQRRIVQAVEEQFTRLDAAISSLKQVQAKLRRYRAALLKAAVEGTLTEGWRAQHPNVEPASDLLRRILDERRKAWEQAELARFARAGKTPPKGWQAKYREPVAPDATNLLALPEGWCYVSVDHVTIRSEYGTSVKCDYSAEGAPVLRIPNIAAGEIDLSDIKFATQDLLLDAAGALQPGDILMCRTNGSVSLIGKAAVIRAPLEPYHSFASYLLRFRLVEATTLPKWLHLFVSSVHGRTFIEQHAASSAGQYNISLTLMHNMLFPVPPLKEQEQIMAEVERRLSVVAETEAQVAAELKRAERLRQSILALAFAGKLVPQDPEDESTMELLEHVRVVRSARAGKPQKPVKGRASTMSKISVASVEEIILQHPTDTFSFDELRKRVSGDYSALRDCIFELLSAPKPVLRPVFDQDVKAMRFVRVKP